MRSTSMRRASSAGRPRCRPQDSAPYASAAGLAIRAQAFRSSSCPMPAPLAPLIGFALGVAFAWWAREELGPVAGRRRHRLAIARHRHPLRDPRVRAHRGVLSRVRSRLVVRLFHRYAAHPVGAAARSGAARRRVGPGRVRGRLHRHAQARKLVPLLISPARRRCSRSSCTRGHRRASWRSRRRTPSSTATSARARWRAARSATRSSGWTRCSPSASCGRRVRCTKSFEPDATFDARSSRLTVRARAATLPAS